MMNIILMPQAKFPASVMSWSVHNNVLTLSVDETTDTFDFSSLPDGKMTSISTTLPDDLIVSAEKKNGDVTITLLDWREESRNNMQNTEIAL